MGDDALRAAQAPTRSEETETQYTLQEAAQELGIDVEELHLAVRAGTLPCTHHYGRSMISRSELAAYRRRTGVSEQPQRRTSDSAPSESAD